MGIENVKDAVVASLDGAADSILKDDFNAAEGRIHEAMRNLGLARQLKIQEAAKVASVNRTQELYFELIAQTNANEFDGPRIVSLFKENAGLWDAVMPILDLNYNLCRLTDDDDFIDTLYVRCKKENAEAIIALARKMGADERDILTKCQDSHDTFVLQSQDKEGYNIVRCWWD